MLYCEGNVSVTFVCDGFAADNLYKLIASALKFFFE